MGNFINSGCGSLLLNVQFESNITFDGSRLLKNMSDPCTKHNKTNIFEIFSYPSRLKNFRYMIINNDLSVD